MNLLQMSLSGGLFILAAIVFRAVTAGRLPKATFLGLWYIALLRLLLPVSFQVPFPVFSMTGRNVPVLDTLENGISNLAGGNLNDLPMEPAEIVEPLGNAMEQTVQSGTAPVSMLPIIWMVGMAVMAGYFILSYLRCRKEFRTALPVQNEAAMLWLEEHPLWRQMEIRQLTGLTTPLVYGIFRPVILMPRDTDWGNEQRLQYILFHEYVHIRRFDAVGKLMASAALCVHWFNPLVWALCVMLNRDIELSCDERVIRHFGGKHRRGYATALIRMEEQRSNPAHFGAYFSKNTTEERIKAIMKCKRKTIPAMVLAVIVVIAGAVAVFAGPVRTETADFGGILRGDIPFLYVSEGMAEPKAIDEVPALFDPYDEYMRIWNFALQDLDGDGEEEVILIVYGAAGDMGGKLILHQIGDEVYGYITDNRNLEDLKTDGTFGYSYMSGAEAGICTIAGFTENSMDIEKVTYASGAHWEWDTFVADRLPATEEEYLEANRRQDEKPDAVWYEFTEENIEAGF